jgi:4-carboxymuconolactone decarboxylase
VAENLAGRRERGLEIYRQMGWGNNQDLKDLDEDLWSLTTDFVFGEVWSRPGLTLREREIAVLSALIALGTEGMDLHLRYAHKLGISNDEIRELIFQVMYYVGQPRGLFAMKRLKAVMAEGSGRKKRPTTKRDKRRR